MAKLNEIVDTSGSHLNRYKLTREDGTSEVIDLDFNPGEDFQIGTLFAAVTMNPMIKKINDHDLSVITDVQVAASSFTNSADYPDIYLYHADIPIQGLLATDYVEVNPSPASKELRCLGPDNQSFDGILRLYATELPVENIVIASILIHRRDV